MLFTIGTTENINLDGYPHGVVVNVQDSNIVVNEFELQSRYYIHFRYSYFSFTRMSLALNNPRRLICH